jgi:hypothetical protein
MPIDPPLGEEIQMMSIRSHAVSRASWAALALALLLVSPLAAHRARAESFCVPGPHNGRSDSLYVACTSGCTYSVGGAVEHGGIEVRQPDARGGDDDDDDGRHGERADRD